MESSQNRQKAVETCLNVDTNAVCVCFQGGGGGMTPFNFTTSIQTMIKFLNFLLKMRFTLYTPL
jgi:hypothetical protein